MPNYQFVTTIVDPNDYQYFIDNINNLTISDKKDFASKALDYITKYDMSISEYFNNNKFIIKYFKIKFKIWL